MASSLVRVDGCDYELVDPAHISKADLEWLGKVGGKPLRTSVVRRVLKLPGYRTDREFRAATKMPAFRLGQAIAKVEVGLIDPAHWQRDESPSEALWRIARILLPSAPICVLDRLSHNKLLAVAGACMEGEVLSND